MKQVFLGLGANLGSRERNIHQAITKLEEKGNRVLSLSPLYETEPWGIKEQPRFLNAACLIETPYSPQALLKVLKTIEKEMGRVPTVRYGPRPIDLDILFYDMLCLCSSDLIIPHPGTLERATVLVPLADIAPHLKHPLTEQSISEHLAQLGPASGIAPYPPGLSS
ncbi:MAG: 2-amino-4-hydroxy-6-hydroxymethyldihydropteridine diphosphokinase [Anaerolineae bacterium]|nr:2-amino-4-hydroxy-6-hydroxymethyldihydropteridine diphosphokinase [Anaerolineae bacterium]